MATPNYQNLSAWAGAFGDFKNVQQAHTNAAERGGFLSAESAAIFAGPSTLGGVTSASLVPIGLIQNFSLQQQRQLNQIFEIGSRPAYFVGGRTIIRATLSRVLFDGPSLLYSMYLTPGTGTAAAMQVPPLGVATTSTSPYAKPSSPYAVDGGAATVPTDPNAVATDPKPGLFWINLASNVFNKPMGLGIIMYDMQGQAYGGVYLERCFVQTHTFSMQAEQVVLAESIQITATHTRPLGADLA